MPEKGKYPRYVSVYDALVQEIKSGKYQSGDQLPGEKDLAIFYGVSRNTLRQALLLLQEDGLIINRQGKGTFVLSNRVISGESIDNLNDPLRVFSNEPVDRVETSLEIRKISPKHQEIFQLDGSKLLALIETVYMVGDKPVGCALSFVPYSSLAKKNVPLDDMNKVHHFYNQFITSEGMMAQSMMRVVSARDPVTSLLKVPNRHQLIMWDEIMHARNGEVAMTQKLFFLPDCYEFNLTRKNGRKNK